MSEYKVRQLQDGDRFRSGKRIGTFYVENLGDDQYRVNWQYDDPPLRGDPSEVYAGETRVSGDCTIFRLDNYQINEPELPP